jgi:hypothetical protein
MKSIATKLTVEEATEVNTVIHDKEALSQFLCYLENKWGDVVRKMK